MRPGTSRQGRSLFQAGLLVAIGFVVPLGALADGEPALAEPAITYVSGGAVLSSGLPVDYLGALYVWRAPPSGESRLRAQLSGIANELRWDRRIRRDSDLAAFASLDSLTLPWAQAEVVYGAERRAEELKWAQARAGAGLAFHSALGRGETYNGLDAALGVEAGGLWFARGSETAPSFVLPVDTLETRLHLRVRADALSRNDLLLPTRGWSAGLDGSWGVRQRWESWGDPSGPVTSGKGWTGLSAYAYAAIPLPSLSSALIPSFHAGVGSGMDRFSSFRLGGGSNWGDFETLSRPVLAAASTDEIATSRYAAAELEFRVQALEFLFLQLRGSLCRAEVPVADAGGTRLETSSFPAVTAGVTTGLPWDMGLEFSWSWNFGLRSAGEADPPDSSGSTKGRQGFLLLVSKGF